MPYYDYLCDSCGRSCEIKHAWDDPGPRKCPHCGSSGKLKRLFSPTGIAFKGSGFYVTDSKSHNSAITTNNSINKTTETTDSKVDTKVEPSIVTDSKPEEPKTTSEPTKPTDKE